MAHQTDKVKLSIAAVMLCTFMLSFGDSIAKFISSEVSLWQIFFLRSLFVICAITVLIRLSPEKPSFMPISFFWVAIRSLSMTITWLLFYIALGRVHLSVVSALLYTFPLFIVLFSPLFGGDKVRPIFYFTIGLALIGMLIIVRPAPNHFNIFALLGLVSAIFFALGMLITNTKLSQESSKVITLGQNLAHLIVGAIGCLVMQLWQPEFAAGNHFYFGAWVSLTAVQWGIMGAMAIAFLVGVVSGVFAYQNAPPPVIATFDYFYLLSSLFWGWLVLSETPNYLDAIGIVIIATAGIVIVRQPSKTIKPAT